MTTRTTNTDRISTVTKNLYSKIALECGTPTYVYDLKSIEQKYSALHQALREIPHTICFAVKANSNCVVLNLLARLGAGFDIVSGGELHRILRAGGEASQTVFAGVGKTSDEIRFAIASQVKFINVESVEELQHIEAIAKNMNACVPIGIRVNPDIPISVHPYLATGLSTSKFGIPIDSIASIWETVKGSHNISVVALDSHLGSGIDSCEPYETALKALCTLANELRSKGAPISYIDLGGGLAVSYSGYFSPLDVSAYGKMVSSVMRGTPYHFISEPGKYLVCEAGVLIAEVLYTKKNGEKNFAIVSAGMNDLIRPSLYNAYHAVEIVGPSVEERILEKVDIVGPVCESGCFLATDRMLPKLQRGDLVIFMDAGAYGFTMASRYNSRPLPAEVVIDTDGSFRVIRPRETFEDLIRHELL